LCIKQINSILEDSLHNSDMHNLLANTAKFRQLLTETYGADNLTNGNFRCYSNQLKASDIEIVAIAFAAEAMQIDS
jgi:hypothetical protein